MVRFDASYVGVLAEELRIDLDGHCSRRMPIHSGSAGIESIELSRDRIRIRFRTPLAERLRLDPVVEITFAIDDAAFRKLRYVIVYLNGEERPIA